MAKENKATYQFPSVFGSHKSMINEEKTAKMEDDRVVVLTDEFGDYFTFKDRLDTGLADPHRYAARRLSKLFDRKNEDKEGK
jgi:hypothetical protein